MFQMLSKIQFIAIHLDNSTVGVQTICGMGYQEKDLCRKSVSALKTSQSNHRDFTPALKRI